MQPPVLHRRRWHGFRGVRPLKGWELWFPTLQGCIDHTMTYNSQTLAIYFDARDKGGYGRWWAMVDVVGSWMRFSLVVEAEARWKTTMEGEQGIPHSFPVENVAKHWPFSIVSRKFYALLSGTHA